MNPNRLQGLRSDRNLTQQEVADELNILVSRYRRWETGEVAVPTEWLIRLTEFFDTSSDWLLGIGGRKSMRGYRELMNAIPNLDDADLEQVAQYAAFVAEKKAVYGEHTFDR